MSDHSHRNKPQSLTRQRPGKALSCIWGGEAVRAASCCASLLNAVRGPNAVTCRAPALHALALASAVLARAVRAVSTASSRLSYARSTARDTQCATSAAFSEQALRCRTQSRCQWSSRYTCHPLSLAPQSRRRPYPGVPAATNAMLRPRLSRGAEPASLTSSGTERRFRATRPNDRSTRVVGVFISEPSGACCGLVAWSVPDA